jgi:hypothetical protein
VTFPIWPFVSAVAAAERYLGPEVLKALSRVIVNVIYSKEPLHTAELAARITDAETRTIDRLRIALRGTVGKVNK